MKLVEFFDKIASTTSMKQKEQILQEYKDEYLLELLNRNLNPYMMFYIKDIPEYVANPVGLQGKDNYKAFINLTDKLHKREITGNSAKEEVKNFFTNSHAKEAGYYEAILTKKAINIGIATVNKVIPGLIPEFKVMLAPSQLPNLTQLQYPLYVQPKYDGFRAIFKDGKFYTRTGLVYTNSNLSAYFEDLLGIHDYVLDGELYIHGNPFQDLAKVLNAEKAAIPKQLKYYVYDCLPSSDWENQSTKLEYVDRLKILRNLVNGTIANYSKIIDSPTDLVYDPSEVTEIYKKYLKAGYEGCMLKSQQGKYQWKRVTIRSGEMIKLKPFETLDLKVTSIYDGEGKYEGKAGGIVVDYNSVSVSVGSGFDDTLREEMAREPAKFIGKIAEIKYFEETEDGSLRFPIFIRWREDK